MRDETKTSRDAREHMELDDENETCQNQEHKKLSLLWFTARQSWGITALFRNLKDSFKV